MATHSSILAQRIPGMGEPGGLPSMGLQSRTRLKRLSSSSSSSKPYCLLKKTKQQLINSKISDINPNIYSLAMSRLTQDLSTEEFLSLQETRSWYQLPVQSQALWLGLYILHSTFIKIISLLNPHTAKISKQYICLASPLFLLLLYCYSCSKQLCSVFVSMNAKNLKYEE